MRAGTYSMPRVTGVVLFLLGAVLLALALLATGCVSSHPVAASGAAPSLVWPPAPAQARIGFVESISRPADIGQKPSVWRQVSGFFTGDGAQRESLVKPFGIALDEQENLCITDPAAGAIFYCDFAARHWQKIEAAGRIHFVSPVAIARRNGRFFVADSELGEVLSFDSNARAVQEIKGPLQRPVALAFGGDLLFVADTLAQQVFAFDAKGELKFQFGHRGSGPGEFNFPSHMTSDGRGLLYVTDSMNARIEVFDWKGQFQRSIGSAGDGSGHFGRPKGAAADPEGRIYVVDAVFDNVQAFDPQGSFLLNWGEAGNAAGQFWLPNGIAINSKNRLFVADSFNHRVQVFDYLAKP